MMEIIDRDLPKNVVQSVSDLQIPKGYVKIDMSSKGCYGVPPFVYVKNFSFEDLIELSIIKRQELLPEKLISILNTLVKYPAGTIIDEQLGVGAWPEQYIIELLIKMYVNYFSSTFTFELEIPEEKRKIEVLVPLTNVKLYDVDVKKYKEKIKIYNKSKTFSASFRSWIRYGDSLIIKNALKEKYGELEEKFENIDQRLESQKDVSLEELKEYQFYAINRLKDAIIFAKIMALLEVDGKDVSGLSIQEKLDLYNNTPELQDARLIKTLNKHYDSLKIGVVPEVTFKHPITGQDETRRFNFRIMDILSTFYLSESDEYSIDS